MTQKFQAEGRERPVDPWETPASVNLHYALPHSDTRVVLDARGVPALTDAALGFIARGSAQRREQRRWLTIAQVARLLEIDLAALRRSIMRNAFPASQPGGPGTAYLVSVDVLESHLYAAGYPHEEIRELARTWTAWLAAQEQQ
jgi:hypothetical protein